MKIIPPHPPLRRGEGRGGWHERTLMGNEGIRILIVDDEEDLCAVLSQLISREGYQCLTAHEGETALRMVYSQAPDVMLLDFKMPGMDGMEVLRKAKELDQSLPVVMITAFADVSGAVTAMKAGVHDYLAKPFDNNEVIRVVHRALAERNFNKMNRQLSDNASTKETLKTLMGPSDAIFRLTSDVNRVAASDFNVVIFGETGSGKELVARAIHQASARSKGPFIPVDCGAIPETLFESELLGHEKGAFTGAEHQRKGKYELANDGTLFLDEIANMPLGSQAKLLRVLQEKTVYRVGGNSPVRVHARVLVASHSDLDNDVTSEVFRQDLFFRLNEFTIRIPPLRERKEDIPYLAKRFLDLTNIELKKNVKGFSESALESLFSYNWPGNVRQLQSTIRRAALLSDEIIKGKHLDLKRVEVPGLAFTPKVQGIPWKQFSLRDILKRSNMAVEREVLLQVLKYTGWNKAKAARLLQVDYKTIHTKVKILKLIEGGVAT